MKSAQRLGFADTHETAESHFFGEFSAKLLEERNNRRRKIVYGCLIVICVLLMARLIIA